MNTPHLTYAPGAEQPYVISFGTTVIAFRDDQHAVRVLEALAADSAEDIDLVEAIEGERQYAYQTWSLPPAFMAVVDADGYRYI